MTIRVMKRQQLQVPRLNDSNLKTAENKPPAASKHPRQAETDRRDVLAAAAQKLIVAGSAPVPWTYKPAQQDDDEALEEETSDEGCLADSDVSAAGSEHQEEAGGVASAAVPSSDGARELLPPARQGIRIGANTGIRPAIRPAIGSENSTANPENPKIEPAISQAAPKAEPILNTSENPESCQAEDLSDQDETTAETPSAVPVPEELLAEIFEIASFEEIDLPEPAMSVEPADHPEGEVAEVEEPEPLTGETMIVADTQGAVAPFPGTLTVAAQAIDAAFTPHTMGAFLVGEDCLTFEDDGETIQVTATHVHVSFMCCEASGKGHGFCLTWLNRNGKECSKVIAMPRLFSDWTSLLGELSDEGLIALSPRHLKMYLLETCSGATLPEVRLITEIGFFPLNPEDPDGAYGFMLPSGAILPVESGLGQVKASELRYRAPFEHKALGAYKASGTLDDWKAGVAPAEGNTLVVFCTCAVLGSIMLKVYGGENCGFHLYGLSSTGKSTAAQVGMSVLGCAADPQSSSKPTTFGSWSATDNGREIMAACANGAALFMDELDSCPKGASLTIYPLLNGVGKVRMRSAGSMAQQYTWRLLALSTGELSLYERIMREPQREAMLGELSRFLDIPVDNLSRNASLTVEEAQALALQLKQLSAEYYGSACVAFVQWMFAHYPTQGELRAALLEVIDEAESELVERLAPRRHLRAAHKRAIRHFALVLAVGRWASEVVLPFSVASIEGAVFAMAEAWCDSFPSLTDEDRLLDSIRAYLRDQGHGVVCTANTTEESQRGRVPKILLHDGRLHMSADSFYQACGEISAVKAGKILKRLDILHVHKDDGQKVKMTMWPSVFRNQRYYALDAGRLLGERELVELMGGIAESASATDEDYEDDQE